MRIGKWVCFVALTIVFTACGNEAEKVNTARETPAELQEVDNVLRSFSPSPQSLSTSGKKKSVVTGNRGTKIYVDPRKLETVDGSPIGNTIDVTLLEINNKVNMMLNNVTTMAGDKLLESGGAFYIKMWSKGIELRLKPDEDLEIEFPKWADAEMELFYGKKDSLGQIGWEETGVSFTEKSIPNPEKPVNPEDEVSEILEGQIDLGENRDTLSKPKVVKRDDVTKEEYDAYLLAMQDYKRRLKEIENEKLTYDAIKVAKLGWVNCDRFYDDNSQKSRIDLYVNNVEEIGRARFYLVFKDINSVMAENYRKSDNSTVSFARVPEGKQVVIIGVAGKGEQVFLFQQELTTKTGLELKVDLAPASTEEIRRTISKAS